MMPDFLANDYRYIRLRAEQIKAGIEPVPFKPDCSTCDDVGWICVQLGPPAAWDCCHACGNKRGRVMP